jgi:hypothetical protein
LISLMASRVLPSRHGQVVPEQYELTSLTQILSQATLQQYGSAVQTSSAQVLHVVESFEPDEQTACAQLPPPPPPPPPPPVQLSPQYSGTSLTQMPSHWTSQQ